jgi:hypothetical protein
MTVAVRGGGSPRPWMLRSSGSRPTISMFIYCTGRIRIPLSRRPFPPCLDLVRAGKMRAIGTSTFPPPAIVEAQWVAEDRGLMARGRAVANTNGYGVCGYTSSHNIRDYRSPHD